MLYHTAFFLHYDPRDSTLSELSVVLANLLLFVTCLGASVFTATLAASLGLKLTGILP
jgi:hypothetical protein